VIIGIETSIANNSAILLIIIPAYIYLPAQLRLASMPLIIVFTAAKHRQITSAFIFSNT
jgi:hypothetical protein